MQISVLLLFLSLPTDQFQQTVKPLKWILSVAHKIFPRCIKERVKIEQVCVEKLPPSQFLFFFCVLFKLSFM